MSPDKMWNRGGLRVESIARNLFAGRPSAFYSELLVTPAGSSQDGRGN